MLKNGPAATSAGDRKHRLVHPQRRETLVLQKRRHAAMHLKSIKMSGATGAGG
jgi:hypothetical protein